MIFYFSGTGNSKYAAEKLQAEEEELINLTDCVKNRQYDWIIPEGEKLGFVFPVYYGGLPSIVQQFLNHVQFGGEARYAYAVITCGGDIMGSGRMLAERLAETGQILEAVYPLRMPDNYVIMYTLDDKAEEETVLAKAEITLEEIRKQIETCKITEYSKGTKADIATALMYPLYAKGRKTKKFWTDESCVSCGACERKCPSNAIRLIDGNVTWVKEQCAHCMACMTCNAIQYGKRTQGKYRYKHHGS